MRTDRTITRSSSHETNCGQTNTCENITFPLQSITRMHSSRMRNVCSSSHVYPSMYWAGGCVSQHALGRGCLSKGVSAKGGCLSRGCLPRGCIPVCTGADTPSSWTESQRCLLFTLFSLIYRPGCIIDVFLLNANGRVSRVVVRSERIAVVYLVCVCDGFVDHQCLGLPERNQCIVVKASSHCVVYGCRQ